MADQLIFLDTEFTSFHEPELISIGLATATGDEFYAEVPYSVLACSQFVRETVLPLLDGNSVAWCSFQDLRDRLLNWLTILRKDDALTICCDSEYDEILILRLLDYRPLPYVRIKKIGARNINQLRRYEYYKNNCLPEHHALNDAKALCYAYRQPLVRRGDQ